MAEPTNYALLAAQRRASMGLPFAHSKAFNPPGPTPVVGAGGGTGTTPGTQIPHVGGDTWEMNSNRGGVQFNGPSSYKGSFSGDSGPTIHGYQGAGLNTRDFSAATGRVPTAGDVEMAQGGGLSPNHSQMGSLQSYYDMLQRPSQWQQLQGPPVASGAPAMNPFAGPQWTGPDAAGQNIGMAADGGDIPAGQPVIVGERGPEMVVPKADITVIPHELLGHGNILEYLKRFMR